MKFPEHKASLTLTHNDHKSYYQTVAESIERGDHGYDRWINEEQKKKAVESNDCWMIQWFPDTPVGSCTLAAADLAALLEAACGD